MELNILFSRGLKKVFNRELRTRVIGFLSEKDGLSLVDWTEGRADRED